MRFNPKYEIYKGLRGENMTYNNAMYIKILLMIKMERKKELHI